MFSKDFLREVIKEVAEVEEEVLKDSGIVPVVGRKDSRSGDSSDEFENEDIISFIARKPSCKFINIITAYSNRLLKYVF